MKKMNRYRATVAAIGLSLLTGAASVQAEALETPIVLVTKLLVAENGNYTVVVRDQDSGERVSLGVLTSCTKPHKAIVVGNEGNHFAFEAISSLRASLMDNFPVRLTLDGCHAVGQESYAKVVAVNLRSPQDDGTVVE